MANIKVSTFHSLKFIANAVTMGYILEVPSMVATLDMQISIFSSLTRVFHDCMEFFCKDRMNICDCRAFTSICKEESGGHLQYVN